MDGIVPLLFKLTGGIGLFLLGMVLLTDGIKSFAGNALREGLVRFTGTPLKAFISGALVTILVQSSTTTTVTVIGFVSAGLLTFAQSIGVVIGASLGTTGTSWIVAALGLKVSVGFYALPLVGIGAFLRLLGKGRWPSLGLAFAGFGLIFVGIETLQDAMSLASGHFEFSGIESDTFFGSALMLLIGIVLTIVMQSSAAAIATTLTALHTDAIVMEQAMVLTIGAAIGTTATGAIASIGGNVPAKRTALAHITFNLVTGIIAFLLLPVFLRLLDWAEDGLGLDLGAMSLAAFHSSFIALGAIIFLPWIDTFARVIERLLPDKEPSLTRHLGKEVLSVPPVALEAGRRALIDISRELLDILLEGTENPRQGMSIERYQAVEQALDQTRTFLNQVPAQEDAQASHRRVAIMHALDHLTRLGSSVRRAPPPRVFPRVGDAGGLKLFRQSMQTAAAGLSGTRQDDWIEELKQQSKQVAELRGSHRAQLLQATASGKYQSEEVLQLLDAMRWIDSAAYHTWRISNYLAGDGSNGETR